MKRKIITILVLTSLASCTTAFAVSLGNILPLGDSITRGSPMPGGYRTRLYTDLKGAKHTFNFVGNKNDNASTTLTTASQTNHEGHGSYTIKNINDNLDSYLGAIASPDYVLLMIGTNDFIGGAGEDTAINRLDSLIGHITTALPNAKVIVSNVILRGESATEESHIKTLYNDKIPSLISTRAGNGEHVSFVDMHKIIGVSDLSADLVHPNQSGYDKMGDAWFTAIQATQAPEPSSLPMCISVVAVAPLLFWRRMHKAAALLLLAIACFGSILGDAPARLAADEPGWTRAAEHTAFQARDSSGEMVYHGKMWILGGWYNSNGPFPNDVWSSADGANWSCVTASAPWIHGDLPTTMVFGDKMWIMGGWHNGRNPGATASNQVWTSTNGADWSKAPDAPWAARCGAAGTVFNGKMWIIGGVKKYYYGTDDDLLNDVWCSNDGRHWTAATHHAPWSPRAYHQVLAFDGKLWLLGGGNYTPHYWSANDVWNSTDGVNWTKVTEHAPWSPRIWHSSEVYRDRMWVLAGWSNNPSKNHNDVWHSTNGANWTQLKTDVIWAPRHEQSTCVFQDKLWVVGGNRVPLTNDVWRLSVK